MEFCWALPVSDVKASIQEAIRAEKSGFDSVLVASAKQAIDPWQMGMVLCQNTSRLRFLIAQNTNILMPHNTMKSVNSIRSLFGNRFDLNVVTSGAKQEMIQEDSHENRYKRTKEFIDCIRLLMEGAATYNGSYFQYKKLEIEPASTPGSRVFVAGSSNDAAEIAISGGDLHICYADTVENIRKQIEKMKSAAQQRGRSLKFGMYVDILARQSLDEAIAIALKKREESTMLHKKMIKLYLNSVDSVGIQKNKQYLNRADLWVEDYLWGGMSEFSRSVGLTILGNYQDVRDKLNQYHQAGIDYFLLVGYMDETSCETIGQQVLPYFR